MSTPRVHGHVRAETTVGLGRQRLLLDIHELVTKPYPKIALHPCEDNLYKACLVLYPENYRPLHLSISFPEMYPIRPPVVHMNSSIEHPNIYGNFICATILRHGEEYTPAYTLKGIAIQLLSFFDSESLEQEHGNRTTDLTSYQKLDNLYLIDTYSCRRCGFGVENKSGKTRAPPFPTSFDARVDHGPEQWPTIQYSIEPSQRPKLGDWQMPLVNTRKKRQVGFDINQLPNEILLMIIENLHDFEHLTNFARAWPRISQVVRDFDVVQQRELQCFCLKKGYESTKLGVGVAVNRGQVSSEFDLISEEAYVHMDIRSSIHNIAFHHWLPLPISRRHWSQARQGAHDALLNIASHLKTPPSLSSSSSSGTLNAYVLFTFMNDIVVRLNQVTEKIETQDSKKSTLRHASEKAIESYFHLFHLLVCLSTEDPAIVQQANKLLRDFEDGKRSKTDCPSLGHLLIALLISDIQVTDVLIKSIITEAITRNVVWLLDWKGAGMAELSYMERDAVSAYRLDKTFRGSRTSYRLLMFSELFRRAARPSHEKSLNQVREELFDRHGGPPRDAAGYLAAEVRRLHTIDNFPAFMREMGLQSIPTPMIFTKVLRATVHESMARGYSQWAVHRTRAMRLRFEQDPHIQLTEEERQSATQYLDYRSAHYRPSYSFFPNTRQGQARGGKTPERR
ncbi:hypothetical protein E0Z10_g4552 [Xylaria hypoxylon]|uniref:UBC core domain-containing protein n=1 Tax=Xylaria hypoxylon TaxID=37992 RepID=A0A4Z0Z3L8_9PEZI|nr:hypothetical protein E0Z10_g4552 [Xylaria hypoxylon]